MANLSHTDPPRTWFRRAGRHALRRLRPLAAPLLNRFQLRLQTAVDQHLAALGTIDAATGSVKTQSLMTRSSSVDQSLAPLSALEQLIIQLERLQLGVDAIRLDQQASENVQRETLARFQSALNTVSTDLVQRADLLLQRIAIPLGADVLIRAPEGFLLAPAEDLGLLAALHEGGGRLEPGTVRIICALLRAGDWAIDVGAHVGTIVLPAAHQVGPTGRIVAVEAASRVGELLRRTIAFNGLSNRASLHICAAGEVPGQASLNLSSQSSHSSLLALPDAERTETVEVRTLDSLVGPAQPIRLVKIDAEGFELPIWRGMRRIIADNPTLAVVMEFGPEHLHRAGVSVESWLSEIQAPDFTAYEIDEVDGSLRPLREVAELGSLYSVNLLLLRQPPACFPLLRFT